MFKIHEFSSPAGELSAVYLRTQPGLLEIVSDDGAWPLPDGAVHAVLARFGAPFDDSARITTVATLTLPDGAELRHVRHLAGYDVIARDYIVYQGAGVPGPALAPGEAQLCALAATVAAALLHLGRARSQTV